MSFPCLKCEQEVTNRQEAILCDKCDNWCHRKCGTGISRQDYRSAVREEREIEWSCEDCKFLVAPSQPLHSSTPVHENNDDQNSVYVELPSVPSYAKSCSTSSDSSYQPANLSPSTFSDESSTSGSTNSTRDHTPDEERVQQILNADDTADDTLEPPPVPLPQPVVEPSILQEVPGNTSIGPDTLHFEVVYKSSRQLKPKLVDNHGHSYNIKETKKSKQKTTIYWQCAIRTKKHYCTATVIEVGRLLLERYVLFKLLNAITPIF